MKLNFGRSGISRREPAGHRTVLGGHRASSKPDRMYRRLSLECLESRTLLSGGPANVEVVFSPQPALAATVLWNNNATGNTAYEVDRSTNGGSTWTTLSNTLSASSTSYTDATVSGGQAYEYRVEALTNGVASTSVTTLSETPSALPSPYWHGDIGAAATVGLAGSASYNSGTYTLTGSGADIWNTSDGFQFAYTALTGNGILIAQVTSQTNSNAWAKAGVMFRSSPDPGATFADMVATPGNGVSFQWRSSAGGNCGFTQITGVSAPAWVKVVRSSNLFTAFYATTTAAPSSSQWIEVGSAETIPMPNSALAGLVITSHDATTTSTATFANVSITNTVVPPPTIASPAAANPSPVTGTNTVLSVLGADTAGEASLTYTWSVTNMPDGATAPTFSDNGDNSAKNSVATFSQAGSYSFLVTITDPLGLSTSGSASVTVDQTVTSVAVAPTSAVLATRAQQQFTATAYDQFDNTMSSQPTFTWSVSSGSGAISGSGLYTASNVPGLATVSVSAGSVAGTASVTIGTPDVAWYTANEAAGSTSLTDSSGEGNTATLSGTYSFGQGINGNGLNLSAGGYASLPTGIVSNLTNFTIATWVEMATSTWSRVFDFGTGTTVYMFLTPSAGGTNMPRFAITTGSNGSEQQINSSIAIPANTWTHVAVTLSGTAATLYINGAVAGTNANMTLNPAALGSTTQNYIGKSQWSADPAMQGEVDDFRIYGRALRQAEVQSLADMNPAAFWKFDETEATTAADSSGNGHTATLGAAASRVGGVVGARALSFNGTSASEATVAGPVVNTAASFTVSAWVEVNSTGGYQTFVCNCGNNVAGYFLQLRGDTGNFALTLPNADNTSAATYVDSGVAPVAGQWYDLVGVADANANTLSIYVNGVLENSTSYSDWWSAAGNTLIGHGFWNGAQTDYVNGSVDEVEIFPTALSARQVLGLHEAAEYQFNEGSGTTSADATGHGNTLTLGSGVSWTAGWMNASAIAFNGATNGTAACANPVLNTAMPFSVSAWVNLASTGATQTFASIGGANVSAFCLQYRGDTGRFAFTRTSADSDTAQPYSVQSTSAPTTNYWYNLIGVNDVANGRLLLYVNGVLQGALNYAGSWRATGATVLGADEYNGTLTDFATAAVDDVRLFSAAIGGNEAYTIGTAGRSTLNVDTTTAGITISNNLFGAFMEDINYGGDGGIYDDEVRNGGFNDSSNNLNAWSAVTAGGVTATLASDSTTGPTSALTMSGKLTVTSGVSSTARVGIANSGYFGVTVVPSTTYTGYFYAKATSGFTGPLAVSLESTGGAVYATATVSAITTSWAKYSFSLTTGASTPSSTSDVFVISTKSASANGQTIWFGATYLFPPGYAGYNGGNNHFRTDLIEKLIALKPAFFRVPGGNYLEGNDYADRFNWQATIGPLEDRPGHNDPWGYWSDDGFGLDEYLQMAEEVGAQPVLAIYAGYTLNGNSDTGTTLTNDVTSAVDELHYCLDPVTTTWGSMRAANGHSAPYNINYVEIGNEDFFSSTYSTRYPLFYQAIKAAFPNLKIIATGSNTGGYSFDVLDEHFYESPQWMINNSNYFAGQARGSYSVFVGEYAAMQGSPTDTLTAGIGDAAWLMGLMRNSDLVTMASYAPLWVNVNSYQWSPDLIGFNGLSSFGSFSYYAQVMLSNNHGTTVVSSTAGGQNGIQTLVSRTGPEYYITLLNTGSTSDVDTISLSGLQGLQPTGTAITLASWDGSTSNSLADLYGISPRTTTLTGLGASASLSCTLPSNSLTILEVEANTAPRVASPASASPSPVTGTTTALSILGADDGGESNLTYTWSVTSGPAAATFSANGTHAAKNSVAAFSKAGNYTFTVTITDQGGLSTTSNVSVAVNQTYSSLSVSPSAANLTGGATQQFTATALDQFGQPLATQPAITWTLPSGPGALSSGGLYTPPYASGTATVQAASGSYNATATVTFSSEAQWNPSTQEAPDTSWSAIGNWHDVFTGTILSTPGVRGTIGDTVLFDSTAAPTVTLDRANPTLAGIAFNNPTVSYTIAQGAGGSLTLQNSGGGATVSVLAGSHTISAPVHLASNTTVNPAASTTLTISGAIDGSTGLTMVGGGTLVLSGANTFSGGLVVQSGTVLVKTASGLPNGGSLTVGDAGAFNGLMVASAAAAATGGVAGLAEPSALAEGSKLSRASLPASAVTKTLSPRAVAAVMAAGADARSIALWIRRAAAANRPSNLSQFDNSRPRFAQELFR